MVNKRKKFFAHQFCEVIIVNKFFDHQRFCNATIARLFCFVLFCLFVCLLTWHTKLTWRTRAWLWWHQALHSFLGTIPFTRKWFTKIGYWKRGENVAKNLKRKKAIAITKHMIFVPCFTRVIEIGHPLKSILGRLMKGSKVGEWLDDN
jgi:hypothetical protein